MNYVVNEITFTIGASDPVLKRGQINKEAAILLSDTSIYAK
jgi:hypothetical protein